MIEYIYGPANEVIGSMRRGGSTVRGERVDVFDSEQRYVGYVDDYGTFDETGYQVSSVRMPGLLLRGDDSSRP